MRGHGNRVNRPTPFSGAKIKRRRCPDCISGPRAAAFRVVSGRLQVIQDWEEAVQLGANCAIIATDTHRHKADVQSALEAACNVLVEKPMATDAASAHDCLRLAQSAGREIWVGCYLRFQEALNIFREQSAQLGKIHSVRIECQSYLPAWRPEKSEVERLLADNRLAREVLGWEPRVGLKEGLKRTIEWIKQHPEKYRPGVYVI